MSWSERSVALGNAALNATSVATGAWPTTPTDGDELVMCAYVDSLGPGGFVTPSGWTVIVLDSTDANGGIFSMWRKVASSEPSGGYTVVHNNTNNNSAAVIIHASAPSAGEAQAAGNEVSDSKIDTTGNTTMDAGTIVVPTPVGEQLVYAAYYCDEQTVTVSTAPTIDGVSMSELELQSSVEDSDNNATLVLFGYYGATAGSETPQVTMAGANFIGSAAVYTVGHTTSGKGTLINGGLINNGLINSGLT